LFIRNVLYPNENIYERWIDQYYLTKLNDSTDIFDFVGRHDNFQDDLKLAMESCGIDGYDSSRYINKGKYNHKIPFQKYYDATTEKIVYKKFKNEIDYYGFKL